MSLRNYHSVYFIGIGGIGMSAIARWFNTNGYRVAGYDRAATPLSRALENEGITIHYEDNIALIPEGMLAHAEDVLVVYTPAVPANHSELLYFRDNGYNIQKRAETLGMITATMYTIAVAGTHGKTTTCSMIAHLLRHAEKNITAFLGGISTNYGSNYLAKDKMDEAAMAIVEADEFDRSFLTLHPDIAVITATDADHLDVYGSKEALHDSFKQFMRNIKEEGKLFVNEKISNDLIATGYDKPVATYGLNQGQFFASNIITRDGFFEFDYESDQCQLKGLKLGVPGFHNVENATVAIAIALETGLSPEQVREGIATYKGVKRRFEFVKRNADIVFVDDYAHHPVEIEAFLKSLKALYPDKKITAIFQPHLYSRTKDFAAGFAESLSLVDDVILLDIYPARELPIAGVTATLIFDAITSKEKEQCTKDQLLYRLENKALEVVATIGAGDIDQLILPIKEYLNRRYNV